MKINDLLDCILIPNCILVFDCFQLVVRNILLNTYKMVHESSRGFSFSLSISLSLFESFKRFSMNFKLSKSCSKCART